MRGYAIGSVTAKIVYCIAVFFVSLFVISGSTDLKVYITSCYEPSVDEPFLTKETKSLCQELGIAIFKFDAASWINCVAWSVSGSFGFAASQNSNVVITDYKKNKNKIERLFYRFRKD